MSLHDQSHRVTPLGGHEYTAIRAIVPENSLTHYVALPTLRDSQKNLKVVVASSPDCKLFKKGEKPIPVRGRYVVIRGCHAGLLTEEKIFIAVSHEALDRMLDLALGAPCHQTSCQAVPATG